MEWHILPVDGTNGNYGRSESPSEPPEQPLLVKFRHKLVLLVMVAKQLLQLSWNWGEQVFSQLQNFLQQRVGIDDFFVETIHIQVSFLLDERIT